MTKTIIEALDDPDLFGGMFDAPSWRPWRVFLKALQALPMDDARSPRIAITQAARSRQRSRRGMPNWLSAAAAGSPASWR